MTSPQASSSPPRGRVPPDSRLSEAGNTLALGTRAADGRPGDGSRSRCSARCRAPRTRSQPSTLTTLKGFKRRGSRCGSVVFVDESAEHVTAFDSAGVRSSNRCCWLGRVQHERTGRALVVVEKSQASMVAAGLLAQELPPARPRPLGRRPRADGEQDPPDRARRDTQAELK